MTDRKPITLRVEGVAYTANLDDLTPALERDLWSQARLTFASAFQALDQGATFAVAVLMWVARRQAGETVAYDVVERGLAAALQHAGPDGPDLELVIGAEEDDPGPPA